MKLSDVNSIPVIENVSYPSILAFGSVIECRTKAQRACDADFGSDDGITRGL